MDEGQFIRGKTKEGGASLDPKTGDQWLTFGGGESEESTGVVDAFIGKPGQSNLLASLMQFNLHKFLQYLAPLKMKVPFKFSRRC